MSAGMTGYASALGDATLGGKRRATIFAPAYAHCSMGRAMHSCTARERAMPPRLTATTAATLPHDAAKAVLAGRLWRPDAKGPSVVVLRGSDLVDVSAAFPTMRDLCEAGRSCRPHCAPQRARRLGTLEAAMANTPPDTRVPHQAVAALADRPAGGEGGRRHLRRSRMLERVIEEQARGDQRRAGRDPRRDHRPRSATDLSQAQARLAEAHGSSRRR